MSAATAVKLLTHPLLTETLISMAGAAKRVPSFRGGRPTNASTTFRWAMKGVKLADGTTVKLEAIKVVSRWVTSIEALTRFMNRAAVLPPTEDVADTTAVAPAKPSSTAFDQRTDHALKELERLEL